MCERQVAGCFDFHLSESHVEQLDGRFTIADAIMPTWLQSLDCFDRAKALLVLRSGAVHQIPTRRPIQAQPLLDQHPQELFVVLPSDDAERSVAVRERNRIVTDETHVPSRIRPEARKRLSL